MLSSKRQVTTSFTRHGVRLTVYFSRGVGDKTRPTFKTIKPRTSFKIVSTLPDAALLETTTLRYCRANVNSAELKSVKTLLDEGTSRVAYISVSRITGRKTYKTCPFSGRQFRYEKPIIARREWIWRKCPWLTSRGIYIHRLCGHFRHHATRMNGTSELKWYPKYLWLIRPENRFHAKSRVLRTYIRDIISVFRPTMFVYSVLHYYSLFLHVETIVEWRYPQSVDAL